MSGSEDFLARWSRRKREAVAEESHAPAKEPETAAESEKSTETMQARSSDLGHSPSKLPEPTFDVSKLPSLDTIGPDTDIRTFLQPGVPAALSRAALRRAWSADPAIRDFIGLSENSWDFTAPDSITGFGPLAPTDDVKRLLAQVFNEDTPQSTSPASDRGDTPKLEDVQLGPDDDASRPEKLAETESDRDDASPEAKTDDGVLQRSDFDDATQHDRDEALPSGAQSRRKHGGALPT